MTPGESTGWFWLRRTIVGLVVVFEARGTYVSAWAFVSVESRPICATEDWTIPVLTDFIVDGLLGGLRALGRRHRGSGGIRISRNWFRRDKMADDDFRVDREPGLWGRILVFREVLDGVVET